ncbi:MAG: protein kinase domain-containing protein, partial [Gemmatimonadaceae bacterium]
MQEAAWALSYAHGRGIVHRDVKPDNILIERATGRALLLDFGISRVADSTITSLGESLGTPQFMSPEQAAGEPTDPRSDLYSLGVAGFFALTGQVPFDAPSVQAILAMHVTKPAPPVATARPGTPAQLGAAIDRCLAKSPEERWPSAEMLVAALQQLRGAGPEVAPQVRSFQRIAEMSTTTVISLFVLLPMVALARPQAADLLLAILFVFTVANMLNLATQAQALRDHGFGYDDVRAAFESDRRTDDETAAAAAADRKSLGGAGSRARTALLVLGVVCLASGAALATRVHIHTPAGLLASSLLGIGVAFIAVYVVRRIRRTSGRGANGIAVRLWMSRFGRTFFRVATKSRAASTVSAASVATGASRHGAAALLSTLPQAARKQLPGAAALVTQLEQLAASLEARERELGSALGELGGAAPAGSAASAHRTALESDLRRARDAAVSQHADVLAALEELRLCFLRLRTGVGTAADGRAALDHARTTIAVASVAPPLATDAQLKPPPSVPHPS